MVSKIRVGLIGVLLMVVQQASIYAFTSVSPSLKLESLMIPISVLSVGVIEGSINPFRALISTKKQGGKKWQLKRK